MKPSIFVDGNSRRDFHPQVKSQQAMLARIDASILQVPWTEARRAVRCATGPMS